MHLLQPTSRDRWNAWRTGKFVIDRRHPLNRHLQGAWLTGIRSESATGHVAGNNARPGQHNAVLTTGGQSLHIIKHPKLPSRSIHFSGGTAFYDINENGEFDTANFTFCCWARADGATGTWDGIVAKTNGSSWSQGWGMYFYAGDEFRAFCGSYSSHGWTISSNSNTDWHHYTIRCRGANWDLFKDGQYIHTVSTGVVNITDPFEIGRVGSSSYDFTGWVTDCRFWKRELTNVEVKAVYNYPWVPVLPIRRPVFPSEITSPPSSAVSPYYYDLLQGA